MYCSGVQVLEILHIPYLKKKSNLLLKLDIRKILTIFFYSILSRMLIMQHGDIESNPAPSKKRRPFSCCHWEINSFSAHKMIKKIIDTGI